MTVRMGESSHTAYYPAADGWTRDTTVDFGDLSRFFAGADGEPTPSSDDPPDTTDDPTEEPGGPPPSGFEPGQRTLVAEDFGGLAVGDFPPSLTYGSGNIYVDGYGGRSMLRLDPVCLFRVPLPEALPERFTISFNLAGLEGWSLLTVAPFNADSFTDTAARGGRYGDAHYLVISKFALGVGFRSASEDVPDSVGDTDVLEPDVVRVEVEVDGPRAKLFVDGELAAVLPRASFDRTDVVEFFVSEGLGDGGHPVYLGDLRIAGDGPPSSRGGGESAPDE
jgi:hypothetical protein